MKYTIESFLYELEEASDLKEAVELAKGFRDEFKIVFICEDGNVVGYVKGKKFYNDVPKEAKVQHFTHLLGGGR